jgi:hypothetical protein
MAFVGLEYLILRFRNTETGFSDFKLHLDISNYCLDSGLHPEHDLDGAAINYH